jgi:DME family drug/metabolite transporter
VVLVVIALVTRRFATSWSLAVHQWRRVIMVGLLTAAAEVLFFIVATGVSIATVVCLGFAPVLLLSAAFNGGG